jgi:hypothetical protein
MVGYADRWSNDRECDVNSISTKKLEQIKDICGEPWNPTHDEDNVDALCQIKALVIPFTNQHGAKIHKVLRVLHIYTDDEGD